MRRMLAIVALAASLLANAPPAGAHACAAPVQVDVGEPATISVGVTAEAVEVVGVDVEVPDGFELDGIDSEGSGAGDREWEVEQQGSTLMFRNGSVPPFSCGYLSLRGTAPERGVLAFPLVIHGADGTVRRLDDERPIDPEGAQMVYAGVGVPEIGPGLDSGSDDGTDVVAIAGWVLIVGGVLAGAAWGLRRAGLVGRKDRAGS